MTTSSRTALIVGGNRGIGLALCRRLQALGRQVIATCRRSTAALDALGVRVEPGIDVTTDDSAAALARRLDGVAIDELVCNAGILHEDDLDRLDLDDVRAQIALITSRMGSIADNGSGGYYGYRMSKAALNAAGMSLARDLRRAGIAVAILHPGYVRTDMTGGGGTIDPDGAARQLCDRIDALTLETSGTFWHASGQILPW